MLPTFLTNTQVCSSLSIISLIYVMTVNYQPHRTVPQNIKEDLTGLPGRNFKAVCYFVVSALIDPFAHV